MVGGFVQDARIRLPQRRLERTQRILSLGSVRAEEPLERVERELLDCRDRERAGALTGAFAAHAVGDKEQVRVLLADAQLRLR